METWDLRQLDARPRIDLTEDDPLEPMPFWIPPRPELEPAPLPRWWLNIWRYSPLALIALVSASTASQTAQFAPLWLLRPALGFAAFLVLLGCGLAGMAAVDTREARERYRGR